MPTSFPKDRIKVLLLEGVHARAKALFEGEGFAVRTQEKALAPEALREALREVHVVGIRSKTQLDGPALESAPRLLAAGCFCIGTNQVDLRGAAQRGVAVFNAPFSNTRSVAELTLGEIIALYRQLGDRSARMHAGQWDKSAAGAHEVRGRTLGIVGYGHIGSQVSVLGEALGMRVLYHDIAPRLPMGNARPVRTLDDLLDQSDVVSLHVPATPATAGLIGPRQIARMKPGALLINNARGSVVDLAALADALRAGRLGGAALDVFPDEPEGKSSAFESPVRGLPNVILTPHVGGSTEEAQEAIAEDVATKLLRFINNGSTTGSVNLPEVDLPEQQPGAGPDATDAPPRRHRVLHVHKNVPGVLRQMHDLIADLGVNVWSEYLQTSRDVGYVVLDVDPTDGERLTEGLRRIPETIRVRVLW